MRKPKVIHNFYKSSVWAVAREIKIREVNGLCERCGKLGEEVHHKKRLTIDNVRDVSISINQENLELLCKDCHNKEHKRFSPSIEFDSNGDMIRK
ncbi:MAG: HNH endonuclease [Tenericutes bacterium]|nr:HNH endonuclease [Mycoplasmatota bacterium]